jgi:hypothetical protein
LTAKIFKKNLQAVFDCFCRPGTGIGILTHLCSCKKAVAAVACEKLISTKQLKSYRPVVIFVNTDVKEDFS